MSSTRRLVCLAALASVTALVPTARTFALDGPDVDVAQAAESLESGDWPSLPPLNCRTPEGQTPSPAYPFQDKYVTIDGYRIHYVEEGHGKPILFVHGNPTWSYIWRNIFPCVAWRTGRRAIAVDLLGLGKSDKPNLDYNLQIHERILTKFIRRLHLDDLIMVGQDWGGPLMTHYAVHNPHNVEALVLLETFAWKLQYSDFGFFAPFVQLGRSPAGQDLLINHPTWFVENFIQLGVINQQNFGPEVFQNYLQRMPTPDTRVALAKFPKLIPITDDPDTLQSSLDFFTQIENGLHRLRRADILIAKAEPGNLISADSWNKVLAFQAALPQTEIRSVGPGVHPVQEDSPVGIVRTISRWICDKHLDGHRDRCELD